MLATGRLAKDATNVTPWISAKDRLPTEEDMLTSDILAMDFGGNVKMYTDMEINPDDEFLLWGRDVDWLEFKYISRWMPIPPIEEE